MADTKHDARAYHGAYEGCAYCARAHGSAPCDQAQALLDARARLAALEAELAAARAEGMRDALRIVRAELDRYDGMAHRQGNPTMGVRWAQEALVTVRNAIVAALPTDDAGGGG